MFDNTRLLTNKEAMNTPHTMPQWHQLLLSKRKVDKIKTVDELIREGDEEFGSNDAIFGRRLSSIHKLKPIYNPQDTKDDLKVEWTPQELIHATVALSNYNVKPLYTRKDPNTVKKVLYIVLLVEKYKPLLKELLQDRRYFERYPEDLKDEPIVYIALLDLLCRGDGPSIEEQLDMSARVEYKNCGLKVIYLQVEKYRTQYYEMVHRRLRHSHVTSFYQLLPSQVPITLDLQYPKKFDMWINKNKLGAKWVDDRVLLEEQSHFKPAGAVGKRAVTYKEIKILPFFYELEASNFFDFMESTNYHNHVFIPADRNHCLAITDLVRQLIKLNAGKGSVIQTHILSLSATAYFAYLLSVCFNPPMKLKVFGADKMKESFDCYFDLLCLKNIKVFSKRFYIQNPRQKDIAKTVSVLVNPETTFNPSLNIIDEAVKRGCDIAYLQSTYELLSQEDVHSLHFSFQQKSDLRDLARYNMQRALTIPKVKFVVYQSFDQSETLNDNNGSYVVNYMTECQHDSEVSINSDLNKADPEYTNYKYSATLDSCFKQRSAVQHPFSSEVSGSDPPFIAIFCRTKAVIPCTETEEENEGKSVSCNSDIKSFCSFTDSSSYKTVSQDHQFEKDVLTPIPPRSSHTSLSTGSKLSKQSRRTLFRAQHRSNDFKRDPGLGKQEFVRNLQDKELSKTKLGIDDDVFRAEHEHTDFNEIAQSENKTRGERGHSFSMASMKDQDKEIKKFSVKKKSIFYEKKFGAKKEELADLTEIEKRDSTNSSITPVKEEKTPNNKIKRKKLKKKGSLVKEDASRMDVFPTWEGQDSIYSSSELLQKSGSTDEISDYLPARRSVEMARNKKSQGATEEKNFTLSSKMRTWLQNFESDDIIAYGVSLVETLKREDMSRVSTQEISSIDKTSSEENQFFQNKNYPANNRVSHSHPEIMKARLQMFEAGERDIDKLINPSLGHNFHDRKIVPGDKGVPNVDEEGENQNENQATSDVDLVDDDHEIDSCSDKSDKEQLKILKEIEEQLKHEMEDEASDVEIFEMDKMDPEKEAKFETFVRDIFEKAMGIKLIETESSESSEDNKPQTENKQKAVEKEKDKLKKPMFFIKDVKQLVALQRTSKRELVKLARKLNQIRDNAECYLPANEECPEKNEEKKYLNKQAHGESGHPKPIETGRLIDIVPHRTPTEGLSQLAKELYELRDIVEYYYNSEVEPLDWRAFIERRVDE